MAFKHRISFATVLAANFGCDQFRIVPDFVSKQNRFQANFRDKPENLVDSESSNQVL